MRWTNSWGRGLNRSAGRAPGHCVLRSGQDVPSFPHAPFLAPALFLRCASDSFSLAKPNTSCKIEWPASLRSEGVRVHPGMPFGFPSETAFGFVAILRRPLRGLQGQGYGPEARLSGLISLLQSGAIKPIVAKISPLPEAADALRLLVEGRPFGRIVLTIFDFAYKKNPMKTLG
jgi:hypothetical protein